MNMKTSAAIAILIVLLALSFYPLFSASSQQSNLEFTHQTDYAASSSSQNNSTYAVIYVPNGVSSVSSDVSSFLSIYGLKADEYGSIIDFSFPHVLSGYVGHELSFLKEIYGVSYFTSNVSSTVTPFLSYTNVSSFSSGVPYYYSPSDMSRAYDFGWPLSQNDTGTNTTIVVIDAFGDPNIGYDISAFDNITGLPSVNMNITYPTGPVYTYNKTWAVETATDVEWAHALAPGAKIVLMVTTSATTLSLQQAVSEAVSEKIGNVISLSWGLAESKLGTSAISTFSRVYQQAAQEDITVLAATGDSGAYDATSNITVNFPSSDPYVMAVGGTSLYPWNGGYYQEAWGGSTGGVSFGSGGGYSQYFNRPYWQDPYGYTSSQRGTPDVSLNANPATGMMVISQGREYKVGGTSIATPIWGDVIAVMDQYFNQSLGFLNPLFYQISRTPMYSYAFADIPGGSNGYYNGTPGWDPVTGLGTPFVGNLINASKAILSPYGAMASFKGAAYNATYIRANVSINGASVSENYNGSTFYYLSFNYNQSNFIKYGISVNNQSIYSRYVIMQNGQQVSEESYLGPFSHGTNNYTLSLALSGNNITMTEDGKSITVNVFLTFLGMSQPSFGTEQYSSMDNLTVIPEGTFSSLDLETANGTSVTPTSIYEMQYSGITDMSNYSSIGIVKSGNTFTSKYSHNYSNVYLLGYNTVPIQITYNLDYNYHVTAAFFLPQSASNATWYVNGNSLKSNTEVFDHGGNYTITAIFNLGEGSATGLSVSRTIYIPNVYKSDLNVASTLSYANPLSVSVTLNYFYNYNIKTSGTIPTIYGSNNLSMAAFGYPVLDSILSGSQNGSYTFTPNKVEVDLFVFPSNASVYVNNSLASSYRGNHVILVTPGDVEIIVNASGFRTFFFNVSLSPGTPYENQIVLQPPESALSVSGRVTDRLFSFAISGAEVSVDNSTYAYSNSSGFYIMFVSQGVHEFNFSAPYYSSFNETVNVSGIMAYSVSLSPEQVNINSIPAIQIMRAFPLLFFMAYVSWNVYHDSNFGFYQIYYSTNPHLVNSTVINIGNQNQTYVIIPHIFPGKTYYLSVVVQLSDGQIYTSNIIQMGYSNVVFLAVNIILVVGIAIYAYFAVSFLGKRLRKKP